MITWSVCARLSTVMQRKTFQDCVFEIGCEPFKLKKNLESWNSLAFFSFIQIFLTFYQGTVLSHVSYDDRISIFKRDLDKDITYQALIVEFDHWNRLSCHAFIDFKRVFVASILAMVGLVVYRNVLTFCTLPCNFSFLSNKTMKLANKPQNLRQLF